MHLKVAVVDFNGCRVQQNRSQSKGVLNTQTHTLFKHVPESGRGQ
jgi:hypothetical protein